MKVIFEFSKPLGTQPVGEGVELQASTAAALQRKGYGKIIEKIVSVKVGPKGAIEVKTAKLSKEDIANLKLNDSLVKETEEKTTE